MKLTVVKCTESVNGGYVAKLQSPSEIVVVCGLPMQTSQQTYYAKTTVEQAVDTEFDIDLEMFDVNLREYTNPETGELLYLKWLNVKRG